MGAPGGGAIHERKSQLASSAAPAAPAGGKSGRPHLKRSSASPCSTSTACDCQRAAAPSRATTVALSPRHLALYCCRRCCSAHTSPDSSPATAAGKLEPCCCCVGGCKEWPGAAAAAPPVTASCCSEAQTLCRPSRRSVAACAAISGANSSARLAASWRPAEGGRLGSLSAACMHAMQGIRSSKFAHANERRSWRYATGCTKDLPTHLPCGP